MILQNYSLEEHLLDFFNIIWFLGYVVECNA